MPQAAFAEKEKPALEGDAKKAHDAALARFHVSASFFTQQRERELSDLKFVDFDEMWPADAKAQRAGQQTGGAAQGLPPTPPRPSIVINLLRAPLSVVAQTRRQARLALEFAPKGDGSAQDVAEVYEDIVRGIQVESGASLARNWAGDRAEKCGLGWYRIDTDYSLDHPEPTDPAWNDQDIVYRRILNQASVYPDPHAQEADFSDGKFLFITEDLPWSEYVALYGDSALAKAGEGAESNGAELSAIGNKLPSWVFSSDGDESAGKTIRIAEYWQVQEELTEMKIGDQRRKLRRRKVLWSKINAVEFLEEPTEWNGAYIPIIPYIGEEMNVNGERRWQGMVRPARDACLAYCVQRAAQIETIGLATKAPYIGYMETIEPYLEWWKQSSTRNFFMLPVSAKGSRLPNGEMLPLPQRTVAEPAIQAITMAAAAAKDDVHNTTLVPPAALGQLDPHDRSGKAIQALQGQAELGTSGYMDNLVNISMAYEGKVLRDLIPRIYDRPGRIVPAVDKTDKKRRVMVNQAFVSDPKTGAPIAVPRGTQNSQFIDLKAGEYTVSPQVGKSFNTQRQETAAAIGNVLQVAAGTPIGLAIIPAYLEELDYPGARKIAEIAKRSLPPELQAAYEDNPEQPQPEQMKAMIQQLQQQLQQAAQVIETKQPELQNKAQIAQMQEQGENQRTAAELQTQIQKAEIASATQLAIAQEKVNAENLRSYADAIQNRVAQSLDLFMDRLTQHLDRTHEATMTAAEHAHKHVLSAQEHEQSLEQGEQAAALAPEPAKSE